MNQLKKAEDDLHALDIVAEVRPLSTPERINRREVRNLVWKLKKWNDRIWFQKSRLNWEHNGDKNTKFFHIIASKRQSRNLLDSVLVNGNRYDDPLVIKQEVLRHFSSAFAENWFCRPKLGGSFVTLSSIENSEVLEAPFTMDEIWRVVKESNGNKAPGPNGFNMGCIQKCWKVMKEDVFHFLQEFHSNGRLVKGLNSSFIALIPKVASPSSLGEFRPINLLNLVYKILSKVLSRRLSLVLPNIISEVQSAFIGGRHIFDGIMIANEVVDWWKKHKKRGLILKLDFEKAYDSVNWNFLWSMLSNFGFGDLWVSWMKECVTTARISVLVNGSPTDEFSPSKGLRQGDPLSPFLFNIVVEGLNLLLARAKDLGLIKGVTAGHSVI